MKKILISLFAVIFISITIMQYNENLKLRREPPSDKWAKEVLIASGKITDYPQLIEYNDKFLIAYTDGDNINLLYVDRLGKKLREKSFASEGEFARDVHVVTDGQDISLNWVISEKDSYSMQSLVLSKELDIKDKSKTNNIIDLKQVGNNLIVIGFKDKIRLVDFKSKKSSELSAPSNSLICGTKAGDKYIVAFINNDNDFCYFMVENGVPSDTKIIGLLKGTTRVMYYSSAVAIEGDKGYILAEYRYQGMYGGSKVMEFALDGSSYSVKETADKDRVISIYNIKSFTSIDASEKGVKIMAGGYRPLGKKETYEDVLELEVSNGIISNSIPMSRTRALSGFSSGYGDTVIFCDVVDYDYSNLYMTSSREDFKVASNINRFNEYVLAFLDTSQGILFTFVYLVAFGALWIIPSFCSVSILSLLEYKFNDTKRKAIFILAYGIAVLFKTLFIYSIVFRRLRYFLPDYLTVSMGLGAGLFISFVCLVYCYRRYIADMQRSTIAANFSSAFILDSWFTLFLFIPFIK